MKLYLASNSPRRKELLERVGIDFEYVDKDEIIEENVKNLPPVDYALDLSLRKAKAAKLSEKGIVIGADTIVVLRGKILEKPNDKQQAFDYLKTLSTQWHTVITAVSLVEFPLPENEELVHSKSGFEATRVLFSELTDDEIWRYIESGEPMDKAGAYGIQEKGALLVQRVEGCFYNVVGFPLFRLTELLKEFNIDRISYLG